MYSISSYVGLVNLMAGKQKDKIQLDTVATVQTSGMEEFWLTIHYTVLTRKIW